MVTKIYHIDIEESGNDPGCLDILHENWSPALNLLQVLESIRYVMRHPNKYEGKKVLSVSYHCQ